MNHAAFSTILVTQEIVFLADLDQGGRSVTNDAEHVVQMTAKSHPDHRIVYRDSEGQWTEMQHERGRFLRFLPWHGHTPQN